jgi:IS605 OrfB family transposase
MQRTLSLKIEVPEGFLAYLSTCNTIFNRYVDWCFEQKSYNKNKAHTDLYKKFREEFPTIPSAIIQSIRDTALESVKALKFKFKPKKKPHSHIRYDSRTISLRGNQLSFSWSGNRIKQVIQIPEFFRKRCEGWKFQAGTIGYSKRQKCFVANLIFSTGTPPLSNTNRVVGVDRGLYNIVSLSNGFLYASNRIREFRRKVLFLKKQLQEKGTRSAKRKLKALSGYEKRFILNENHKIAKQLVDMPFDIYVLEDLSGIRKQKSKGKKLNKWLSNWSFWQLEQLLTYKAEAVGKQVVKEDARYTSQKCSDCGKIEKSNRNGSHYTCSCGYRDHSDTNAAKNIRNNTISKGNDYLISAAEKQKAEQAMCQLAECIDSIERVSDTSPVALARGN